MWDQGLKVSWKTVDNANFSAIFFRLNLEAQPFLVLVRKV